MSKESRKKSSRGSVGRSGRQSVAAPRSGKAGARAGTKAAGPPKAAAKAKAATTAGPAKTGAKTPARSLAASKPVAKRVKPPAAASRAAESGAGPAVVLEEGAIAPDFTLPRDGGGTVRLADYAGRKLVLFFYPKANTPGCTREAIDFTRLREDFAACGTAVLGVSADSVKAQDGFRDKHQLAVPLLSDATHAMLEAYGAWGEKSLYGRKFLGIIRSTVLIGSDGRIARIWRNVKVDGHAEAVLAAARAL
ncbi:peroxiredoxin [Bradyrhizobium sp. STM 3557]|uniref:peroxiredoxin n=1 Tax=Bradyrhizobium sp. STM 3557 TaxID=578920 RepID=UPI00389088A8